MKTTLTTLALALLCVAMAGCQTSHPGGANKEKDASFRIATPLLTTHVKQGELETINISVRRDDFFKQDVTLRVTAPSGLAVEPTKILVKASDKPDVQLRVTADKHAALGDYEILVAGTPETGVPTSMSLKVRVVAP